MRPVFAFIFCLLGCADPAPPPLDAPTPPPRVRGVRLAGAAEATPLLTHLARQFEARAPGDPILVDPPLGEAGGRAALAAGLIDAALSLGPPGGEGLEIARTEAVLAVGPGVHLRALAPEEFIAVLEGAAPAWPDGLGRQVLLRPVDDPLQAAVGAAWPGLSDAFAHAVAAHRFPIIARDARLRETLGATPGAMAIADRGNLSMGGAPVWVVTLGKAPPELGLFVLPGPTPPARLSAFLAFARSPDGQGLVTDLGFGPAGGVR